MTSKVTRRITLVAALLPFLASFSGGKAEQVARPVMGFAVIFGNCSACLIASYLIPVTFHAVEKQGASKHEPTRLEGTQSAEGSAHRFKSPLSEKGLLWK